jgi:rod shape-determining protein MreD
MNTRPVRAIILMGLVLVLQDKLPPHIGLLGVRPDFALLGVFVVALAYGERFAAWTGFASGLFLDIAVPAGLGARALSLSASAFLVGRAAEHVDTGSLVVRAILLVGMGLIDAIVYSFAMHIGDPVLALTRLFGHHVPDIGYTLLVAFVTSPVLGRLLVVSPLRARHAS